MGRERLRAAWREPMTWLVVGLPLVVVIASAVTIAMARRSPADASDGETRRIAQIQIDDLAPDREAARLALHARMHGDPASGVVRVQLEPAQVTGDSLELALLHPLDERLDRRLALQRDGDAWRATTAPWPAAQAWELRLKSPRGDWRLAGRLAGDATRATLSPTVER